MTYYAIDVHFTVHADDEYSAVLKADDYLQSNGLLGVQAQLKNEPPILASTLHVTRLADDKGKALFK